MTTLNTQIKSDIFTIANSVFHPIVKANLIVEQLKKTYTKDDFYELFYSRNLGLQESFFPYIEFDNHSSTAFDNIVITAYDQNAKPHEYTFKFHKENGIQVNYEKYLNEYLHVA